MQKEKAKLQLIDSKNVLERGEAKAENDGFDSLQAALRFMIRYYISGHIDLTPVGSPYINKQQKAVLDRKLSEFEREEREGRIRTAHSVEELMADLNS